MKTAATPTRVRICLLGSFRVLVGPHAIDDGAWRLRKAKALIKMLALAPGHSLHGEQVINHLWPHLPPEAGANNLYQTLHVARRAFDKTAGVALGEHFIRYRDRILALDSSIPLWIDVAAFETAAAVALRGSDIVACEEAVSLHTGDLLPEDLYEEWATERREGLHQSHLAVLLHLARLHEDLSHYKEADEVLARVLAQEPAHEDAHVRRMRLYAFQGQRREAVQQYQRLEEALLKHLDAKPDANTTRLFREILSGHFPGPGVTTADSPLVVASAPRMQPIRPARLRHKRPHVRTGNLPAPLTSFIGREKELAELRTLMLDTRLLTLTGPAGCGKTRLALELAAALSEAYPDGIWWVDLQALRDASLVPHTAAAELGVRQQPGQDIEDVLVEGLRDKRALIVLDNCEHLVAACSGLAETLLRACWSLQVMATSRERLGVEGEMRWPVPPMSVPPLGTDLTPDDALGFEAVRLFESRSRAVQPGFAIASSNAATVAEICRRLDGLPLAIELAAARAHLLSIDQIPGRLPDHFRVSATSGPTQRRYATLGEAIDWSYRFLTDAERTLFNRLGMFAGSFTSEAAHEICGDGGVSATTQDLLSGLVEKSMIALVETPKGEIRYRLLETLRQFGLGRLRRAGEEEATARRRRDFFVRLAEQATTPELRGPRQAYWLDRLDLELDNFRETLARCRNEPDGAEAMLRMVAGPQIFWMVRGHYDEGRRWLEAALALDTDSPSTLRVAALLAIGGIAQVQGDVVASREIREKALRIARALGDQLLIGATLRELGFWYQDQGDSEMARSLHDESLETHRGIGRRDVTWLALRALGWIELDQGNHAKARGFLEASVEVCREIGHAAGVAGAFRPLGQIALEQGDYGTARALHESSLATFRELGSPGGVASSLCALGRVAQCTGDLDTARALQEESLEMFRRSGNPWGIARCLRGLGRMAGLTGDHATAVTSLEEGLRIFRGLSFAQGIGSTLCALGKIARQQGRPDRAMTFYIDALSLLRRIPDRVNIAECLEGAAAAAATRDRFAQAVRLLGAASALRDAMGVPVLPCDRSDYELVDAAVRSGLMPREFTAEWNSGREMSLEEAIEFTSAVADPGGR